ncbi:DUF2283 domain-containing protein [Crocosphaera sp.]|uniref:DUF2283 domain-containing protein n=1 Tax=Crocosphaera sp. TaxID=2729996 RepID=UPI00262DBE0C|nr:DUF2283 domain-containing protein [Crocosphaera sp.]MDJ0581560.1 DUF2283 domain-containing protein [Crocosphaera sp.]
MKIQYFEDTDTVYIIFSKNSPIETRDLDENTLIDLDENGQMCSLTIQQAKNRVDIPNIEYIAIDRLVRTHKLYFKGTGNREQGTEKCPNSFGDCYKTIKR